MAFHELDTYRVGTLPTIFYIPDYLSDEDQHRLLQQIYAGSNTKWKLLKNRRLQNWGGIVHEKGLLPQQLPPWLSGLTGNICKDVGLYPVPINHVLINEYLPGQGIMPHQDGPAYFPVVAILSLGSPAVMEFTPHQKLLGQGGDLSCAPLIQHPAVSVILMPGSLLVFKDNAYKDYLHGISESMEHIMDKSTVNMHVVNKAKLIMDRLFLQKGGPSTNQLPRDGQSDSKDGDKVESITRVQCGKECSDPDVLGVIKRDGTRISLTCRLVPKVHKKLFKI